MIILYNIYVLLKSENILKLKYDNYNEDNEEMLCYCGTCNFMRCYISPIINFFIYKLKIKN
jgi:hypothetical protein